MATKASVTRIIAVHFESLWKVFDPKANPQIRNPRSVSEYLTTFWDFVVLFGIPIIAGLSAAHAQIYPGPDSIGWIVSFVSLTSGLLFSVLVLMFGAMDKPIRSKAGKEWRLAILEQLGGNVLFAVLLGFASVLGLILNREVFPGQGEDPPFANAALSMAFLVSFLLHLGLILKRTHALFLDTLMAPSQ